MACKHWSLVGISDMGISLINFVTYLALLVKIVFKKVLHCLSRLFFSVGYTCPNAISNYSGVKRLIFTLNIIIYSIIY